VQRVEWNTSKGVVYKIDYYNRYGYAYCTEYLNTDGTSRMKEYYTSQQKLVACKNFSNGVVSLYEQDHIVAMFDTEADLEKKLREENDDNICI